MIDINNGLHFARKYAAAFGSAEGPGSAEVAINTIILINKKKKCKPGITM